MSDDEGELVFHDEIELEDFEFDEELGAYTYPCPCGDQFIITEDELEVGGMRDLLQNVDDILVPLNVFSLKTFSTVVYKVSLCDIIGLRDLCM